MLAVTTENLRIERGADDVDVVLQDSVQQNGTSSTGAVQIVIPFEPFGINPEEFRSTHFRVDDFTLTFDPAAYTDGGSGALVASDYTFEQRPATLHDPALEQYETFPLTAFPIPDPFVDPALSPARIARDIGRQLFNGAMSAQTELSLVAFLEDGKLDKERIRDAIGLAISSPEFQEY